MPDAVLSRRLSVLVLALAGLVAACNTMTSSRLAADARGSTSPPCFGAAALDRENPCVDHALTFVAIPTPDDALLQPDEPCRPIADATPPACGFGAPLDSAASSVALLGDSHATAWRAAVAVVADARRWHGVSMNQHMCPFTFATTPDVAGCEGWAGLVLRWLRKHPEVHQVVVAANRGAVVVPANGHTMMATQMKGYIDAWNALPDSVHDVFVLRDVPHSRSTTAACVSRSLARHRNPGRRCARLRSRALQPDALAMAARRAPSQRVSLVDLSSFMCDDKYCFPVVGGALVIKDIGHLTRTFSASLGPYLDREITRLQHGTQ